jgi:hypothetical protein
VAAFFENLILLQTVDCKMNDPQSDPLFLLFEHSILRITTLEGVLPGSKNGSACPKF